MCSGATLWSSIPRIYYGTSVDTLKRPGLKNHADSPCEEVFRLCSFGSFEATGGLLGSECNALFEELAGRKGE